jgi:hypothetical protein
MEATLLERPWLSVLAFLIALLCCGVPPLYGEEQKGEIDRILSNFPGYHLLTLKERDSDMRAFFLQRFPKAGPSLVHADFDGDGHLDYALLLKNDKSQTAKLVVLLCSEGVHCRTVYDLDVTASSGSVYLRPAPVGSTASATDAVDARKHPSLLRESQGSAVLE